jgi:nucleotide-binding universal stress UspA family protein
MWLTKKILVPTDFAESSRRACDVGLELAKACDVPLILLHVFPLADAIYSGAVAMPIPDYAELVEEPARAALREEAARMQGKGVVIETLLKMGSPWEQIIATVRSLDPGLIVMGTHGRRGLPRAILGSVAEKVVRLSPVPVLTVRGAEGEAKGAAETVAP